MNLSVTDPIGKAWDRTQQILFKPFDAGKWFKLGFCAWLATFLESGSGGGSGNFSNSWDEGSAGDFNEGFQDAQNWVAEHQELVIAIASGSLFLIVALIVLFSWLGSRGRFMFLDGVAHNRGEVAKPWNEFRALGNSLFRFQLGLTLGGFLFFVASAAAGLAVAWSDIQAEQFEDAAIGGLALGFGMLMLMVIVLTFVNLFTRDFVVPAMYARNLLVSDAWAVVRSELLAEHTGTVALYCLMKFLLSMLMGILLVVFILITCCIAAIPLMIPYIGTVLLLPMFVFMRSYSVYFVEQLGDSWKLIAPEDEEPAEPAWS